MCTLGTGGAAETGNAPVRLFARSCNWAFDELREARVERVSVWRNSQVRLCVSARARVRWCVWLRVHVSSPLYVPAWSVLIQTVPLLLLVTSIHSSDWRDVIKQVIRASLFECMQCPRAVCVGVCARGCLLVCVFAPDCACDLSRALQIAISPSN